MGLALVSGPLDMTAALDLPYGGSISFLGVLLKGIYPEFQVIRGFSQKIPAGLLSYDQIHS